MKYEVISADCHVDLIWLDPELFVKNARAEFKDRMPYVTDGPKGPIWVTKAGAQFGLMNGMGSVGREYVPGQRPDNETLEGTVNLLVSDRYTDLGEGATYQSTFLDIAAR